MRGREKEREIGLNMKKWRGRRGEVKGKGREWKGEEVKR
jgi:hypothetical protein